MAFLLGCEKATVDFPTKRVFDQLTVGVNTGDRIGIVGQNGHGKSTLLRLLSGALEVDAGRVICTRGVRVGVLGQTDSLDAGATVEASVVGDMPEYEWAACGRVRGIIDGLLGGIDWHARVGTLSGGQRRRVDLARLLVGTWDVIMLDEPTNHLDMRAITWLAEHLKTVWRPGQGALLVVTHDRWFLDEVCTSMWEVHGLGIEPFEGGYSAYIQQRVERDRQAALAETKRQNLLRRELAWLSRGARARATKPKFHVAAARALIADVPPLRDELELKRMAMARLGKRVVELEGVCVEYAVGAGVGAAAAGGAAGAAAAGAGGAFAKKHVLRDITWIIGPGDRVGLVGENGAGKTTLLKVIQGKLAPTRGGVLIGQTVRFAVLSQHLDELTALGDDRVRQVISRYTRRIMLDGKEQSPSQLLEKLGFDKADLNEPVCDLSGGQKRRLALMLILLDEPNVLILDEPGNDLDTDMMAAVENLLDGWPGTLVLVTHDRYMMERVTDNQFAVIDGQLRHLPGGVDEYLRLTEAGVGAGAGVGGEGGAGAAGARGAAGAGAGTGGARGAVGSGEGRGAQPAATDAKPAAGAGGGAAPSPKLSGGAARELRKKLATNEKKTATLQGKIEAKKAEMAQCRPTDYKSLAALQEEIAEFQAQIEALELEWLEVAEALGE